MCYAHGQRDVVLGGSSLPGYGPFFQRLANLRDPQTRRVGEQIPATRANSKIAATGSRAPTCPEPLDDPLGRRVDLHPLRFAEDGSAVQASLDSTDFVYPSVPYTTGCIAVTTVGCLTAQQQLAIRPGYAWRDRDYHHVAVLRRWVSPLHVSFFGSARAS